MPIDANNNTEEGKNQINDEKPYKNKLMQLENDSIVEDLIVPLKVFNDTRKLIDK